VLGLESEIDVEDFEEAAQQQAGADEQHAGESDFGDDEDGAEALMLAALAGAGAGVLERLLQVAGGHAEAGDEAEEDGGEDGDEDGPAESGAVDVQRAEQRQGDGSLMASQAREWRRDQPQDGSRAGEDEAFGEQLAHDAGAAGAESGAHGELLGAGGGAGEKQVGEVDAGDEQDAADSGPEDDSERRSLPLT
jgi:GNAT superfamily N-acetyltransferase